MPDQPQEPALTFIGFVLSLTRGNLTAEERQFLEQVLYELRLRFVEASGASPASGAGKLIIEP
jgi:hypothetical protein